MTTEPADILQALSEVLSRQEDISLAGRGWLTIKQAMIWTGFGRDFLSKQMKEGRLWFQVFNGRGGKPEVRIPKAHLDGQMIRRFPILDIPLVPDENTVEALVNDRPLTRLLPGPKAERPKGPRRLV